MHTNDAYMLTIQTHARNTEYMYVATWEETSENRI